MLICSYFALVRKTYERGPARNCAGPTRTGVSPKLGIPPYFTNLSEKIQKDIEFLHKFVFSIFALNSRSLIFTKSVVIEELGAIKHAGTSAEATCSSPDHVL